MKHKIWLIVILGIHILAGCTLPFADNNLSSSEGEGDTLGLIPYFTYEVVEQTPNILVNQTGYLPENRKMAVLQGNLLENVFYVYNAATDEVAYEGILKSDTLEMEDAAEEEMQNDSPVKNIYPADFSEVTEPGTYYLYHSDLGYSYSFEIRNDIYDKIEKDTLSLIEEETTDTSLICYQLAGLLLAKELYPENILEQQRLEQLCQEKIELLLQAQDSVTGNVYADVFDVKRMQESDETKKQQYISLAATAEFAGTLAIYAYQIQDTDRNLFYQIQTAAERAYRTIQNSLDNVGYDAGYFAAANLYRLTGKLKYSQAIGQYLAMKEEQKSYTEYDFSLFGDYAYLTLRQGSNLEWSELIMKKIMKNAEQIAFSVGKNSYYISEKREYNDINGILRDMSNMALVNYIITNHEYSMLQKNYLDYLLGRNSYNICFMDGFGIRNAVESEKKINAFNGGLFYLLLQSTKI